MRGFGLPDVRLTAASNAANPTESTPRPGSAVAGSASSKFTPVVSNAQGASIDTYVTRAGNANNDPLRRSGLAASYRLSGGTYYGWLFPSVLGRTDVLPSYGSIDVFDGFDCCTIPSTQKVVAVYFEQNALGDLYSRTLDPADWTWDAEVDIRSSGSPLVLDGCCCVLPDEDETVLVMTNDSASAWTVFSSTDAGATYSTWATRPFQTISSRLDGTGAARVSRVVASGDELLFIRTGSGFAVQYASNDMGTTFTQVGSDWTSSPPTDPNLVRLAGGSMALAAEVNGAIVWIKIGSAYTSLESATSVQILGASADAVAAWVDDDGACYVTATQNGVVRLFYSADDGATWTEGATQSPFSNGPFNTGDSSTKWLPAAAATSSGRAILLGNGVDGGVGTTYDGMIYACQLGGWSNVEIDGWYDSTNAKGRTWIPIERPDTISGITVNSGGTNSATLTTPGMLRISTTSGSHSYDETTTPSTTATDFVGVIELDVGNGNITGGSLTSPIVSLKVMLADGADTTDVEINLTDTTYAVWDNNAGANRGTVTHGITGRMEILVYHNGTSGLGTWTWYRAANTDKWNAGHDDVTSSTTVSVGLGSVEWGQITTATAGSDWYSVKYLTSTTQDELLPRDTAALQRGKALSARPYPLPNEVSDSSLAAFLAAVSGPGVVAETHDIDVQHDYPKERAFVEVSPSSEEQYRSTVLTETVLAQWEPNEAGQFETSLGNGSVYLYLEGINFRKAKLKGSTNGGSSYATIANFDSSLSGGTAFDYTLIGEDSLEIDTAQSGNLGRYVWANELVGGTVYLGMGGTDVRRITRNTEGSFDADGTTRRCRIWFEGADGTEASTGELLIWAPRGVCIVHNIGAYDTYQVVIDSQATYVPDSDSGFRVGRMMVGSVHPAGKQWSDGWSVNMAPNVASRQDPNGYQRLRRMGKARRDVTLAWPDGVDLTAMRGSSPSPDYLIASSGNPLAAVDDVPYWLMGTLEYLKSGEHPCLVLFEIPDASNTTITDWSLFVCGNIGSAVDFTQALGEENSAEFGRVSPLTIAELP